MELIQKAKNLAGKVVEGIKQNVRPVVAAAVVGLGSIMASPAHAQTTTFDPADYTADMAGAVTTAVPIVAGLVALGAGILIYKKVRAFFKKAN
jgi:hypothetical protein